MKKIKIIYSFLISILSGSIVFKMLENDTFSAIKIGQYILKNGVDFVEHFNINNNLYYHNARWLFNALVALIYNSFNFVGIYIFVIIISIILGLVIFNILLKMKNNMFLSFIITIVTMLLINPHISARAQLVSYIFLILEVYFIEKLIDSKHKKYILYIIICSILIANIHTTVWPMTLIFFLPYFAEYILSKIKIFQKQKVLYFETKEIKLLLITFLLVFLSGLCTPLSLTPYTYMFKTMSGFSTTFIIELQHPKLFNPLSFTFYAIFYTVIVLYFKVKIKASDLFMILGLILMSFLASRNCAFLCLISSIVICRLINTLFYDKKESYEKVLNYFMKEKTMIFITVLAVIITSFLKLYPNLYVDYVNEREYPVGASNYILNNIDIERMRIYNGFNYGSYLEYRGMKVFLDSRSEVYCKEYNDTSILEDWYNASRMKSYYKDIFDKYKFTHILLYRDEQLKKYVDRDKDYKVVYKDKYFILYEKVR